MKKTGSRRRRDVATVEEFYHWLLGPFTHTAFSVNTFDGLERNTDTPPQGYILGTGRLLGVGNLVIALVGDVPPSMLNAYVSPPHGAANASLAQQLYPQWVALASRPGGVELVYCANETPLNLALFEMRQGRRVIRCLHTTRHAWSA